MNVQTMFPKKWLCAADLMGRTVTVYIDGVAVETIFNTRLKKNEQKLAVAFHSKQKRLLINKTQAYALAAACGSPETDNWPGHTVLLSVGIAPNGQETIIVTAAPEAQTNGHAVPAQVEPEVQQDARDGAFSDVEETEAQYEELA